MLWTVNVGIRAGWFANVAFNVGDGDDLAGKVYIGHSDHGKVIGNGGNVGFGLGDAFWSGPT